jgi:hypothetical protein
MGIALAALAACLLATGQAPSAEEGFAELQALVASDELPDLETILPASAFEPWEDQDLDALRAQLVQELREASVVEVREERGRAVARFRMPEDKTQRELPLRLSREIWHVDAARSFPLDGGDLEKRKGRKPSRAKLTMRTENGPYVDCALSLVHASDDAELCGQRMDLWYCHNGDLHGTAGNRIADLGKQTLKKAKELPVTPDWRGTQALQEKHSYLVRCQSRGRADFFAVIYVKKLKKQTAELEWTLLTGGFGVPDSIARPQLPSAKELLAPDPVEGLCGKNG